ncbi:hypothetical protein GCM10020367_43940 [Streptomyces sannanensis]|uniref:Aldehyde dehydrogenase family protein n=1 Tax=Streptomyces sannanensis TaxID=285536 RepID=A0ABP6SFY6_9ACTN
MAVLRELKRRGIGPDDRVLLTGANTEEFILALFALMECGVSVALVDCRIPAAQQAQLVADAGVRWLLTDDPLPEGMTGAGQLQLSELVATALAADGPSAPGDGGERPTFERWFARDDALIVWSSGSTGAPKGIVRSGGSVRANTERTAARMAYRPDDVLLPLLPFTHQYGLSMLLLWRMAGATLVLQTSSRRIDMALAAVRDHGVTVVDAVPAAYHTLLNVVDSGRAEVGPLASVRMWCVGGEPLGRELAERFTRTIGKPLLDGYGSSEAGNIALAVPPHPVGCGRPLDRIQVEVVDEDGRAVAPGVVGEIVVRTPDYMTGLLGPGGTVRPVNRQEYRTDDIGRLDAAGNLTVLGRRAAVHRLGHTLYPDGIADRASACGAPVRVIPVEGDRDKGAQLVFFVVDESGRPAAYWRKAVTECVAEHEWPNRVVVLSEFPLNNTGKVDRQSLQKLAVSAVARDGRRGVLMNQALAEVEDRETYRIPFQERLQDLHNVVDLLRTRREEVLQVLFETCNYRTACGEIDASIAALEGAHDEVMRFRPPRVGQIGVLMPSNIPLYGYVLYLLIPSLYSERVAFRPSGRISSQTEKLHKLLGTVHDLPIEQCLTGQKDFLTGEAARSDVLVFTGTFDNAEKIRGRLRKDQLFLYFGQGVNPFVVGPDADISKSVDGALHARMMNSGQDCFGPDVFFVHTSVSSQFCNLLGRRVRSLKHGRYEDATADYSSMYYLDAFESALDHLIDNRAFIAAGGRADLSEGHLSPTVLIRPVETSVRPPELFAPIFNVVPYTGREWLRSILTHQFFEERAMAATVYGDEPELVELLRQKHTVSVNETLVDIEDGNAPFGGTGVRANYAAVGGDRFTEPLLISKAVADHLAPGGDPR